MSDNTDRSEFLVWADVETTGLNPWTGDVLLDIAVLVTDTDLTLLDEGGYQTAIYTGTPAEVAQVREATVPYVQDMHDRTGLWGRIASLDTSKPLDQVDAEVTAYVKQFVPTPRVGRLAGNSVRLDLNFIEKYLPTFSAHLHYRMFDVTGLSSAARWWGGMEPFSKESVHTALDDIRESLDEARAVRDFWLSGAGTMATPPAPVALVTPGS